MKTQRLLLSLTLTFLSLNFTGCKISSFEVPTGEGKAATKIKDYRLFMSTGAEYNSGTDTNGNKFFKAKITSSPTAEAMGAVAEGVARGLKP